MKRRFYMQQCTIGYDQLEKYTSIYNEIYETYWNINAHTM